MKKLLLSAVVLLSVGLNAQETGGVGINTENPKATLDVNGDARLQKVELMTMSTPTEEIFPDCPCVLTIDKYGVIKRIPKSQFVITDGSTGNGQGSDNGQGNGSGGNQGGTTGNPGGNQGGGGSGSGSGTPTTFTANKTVELTRQWTDTSCPEGKEGEEQTLTATGEATATSTVSQDDADDKATALATQKANEALNATENEKGQSNETCRWGKGRLVAVCNPRTGSFAGYAIDARKYYGIEYRKTYDTWEKGKKTWEITGQDEMVSCPVVTAYDSPTKTHDHALSITGIAKPKLNMWQELLWRPGKKTLGLVSKYLVDGEENVWGYMGRTAPGECGAGTKQTLIICQD